MLTKVHEHAKRVGAALYYDSLRTLRVPAVRRRWCDAAVVLCYHNVLSDDEDEVGAPGLHVRISQFARQIRWLADHYDIVTLGEFVRQRSVRWSPPLAAITFDDGYAGVFAHAAPLLERLGIPATVFVVADAPGRRDGFWWDQPDGIASLTPALRERWLRELRGDGEAILSAIHAVRVAVPPAYRPADWSTIRAHAQERIDVGVHSATHRFLPALTDAELEREIVASRALIHDKTGTWPEFFAYPYGLCDARVRAAVRAAGYRAAFGVDPGPDVPDDDRWAHPRTNVPSGISDSAFEAWTAGLH
jgi:peptidoglycan/xylan/chitin deacetylase (PgdA/CDA1 family)